jgi:hypothetical protein
VDFHFSDHHGWGETTEQKEEYRGPAAGLGIRGEQGLPFTDLLYYYHVDFHFSDHHCWGETTEQKHDFNGPAGGLGTE